MDYASYQIPAKAAFSIRLPDGDFLTRHDGNSTVIVLAPPKINPTRTRPTPDNCRFAARVADQLDVKLRVELIPAHRMGDAEKRGADLADAESA